MTKVLIIEDVAESRAMLKLQVRALGVDEISEAADGEEALLMLDFGMDFDFILCDWHMDTMDGLQFCVASRRHLAQNGRPPIPMVLVTADPRAKGSVERDRARVPAADLGIVEILAKPVSTQDLRGVVNRLCGLPA